MVGLLFQPIGTQKNFQAMEHTARVWDILDVEM